MIITIDGPAASGKTTVARILAERLGLVFWESGALYRAITYKAMQKGINLDDEDAICEMMRNTELELRPCSSRGSKIEQGRHVIESRRQGTEGSRQNEKDSGEQSGNHNLAGASCFLQPATCGPEADKPQKSLESINSTELGTRTFLDGHDVSAEIKSPHVTREVWRIAHWPKVRELLMKLQREMAKGKDLVAEGRDMGTVVFPFAEKKFYLDGSLDERARRRYKELCEKGLSVSFQEVRKEIEDRDRSDTTRDIAPLRKAPDALYLDTTAMTVEEVVGTLMNAIGDLNIRR